MKEQLSATCGNSKDYTLAVAAAMPENEYGFTPIETVWGFGELIHHIAYGIQWWEDNYLKKIKTKWDPPPVKGGKKEIMSYLAEAYSSLQNTISKQEPSDELITGFFATLDHITHHRGQAVLYLRCKGIVPPEYTY